MISSTGGYVTFGEGAYGGKILGKGKLKTSKIDFEDVYLVSGLKYNLFSVSQICDRKNFVLFTDTACYVLSSDFVLPDESQLLLKVPREKDMYCMSLDEMTPKENLTCLVAKASNDTNTGVQTRSMVTKKTSQQGFMSIVYEGKKHESTSFCLFACFLSQIEPKNVMQALAEASWVEVMNEELVQFELQDVWELVDLPPGMHAIVLSGYSGTRKMKGALWSETRQGW